VLLVNDLETEVGTLMQTECVELQPDEAEDAAKAFERYDLVSAPVVDSEGKLIGRVTVNEVVDFIREEAPRANNWPGRSARRGRYLSRRCGIR
jgi:magnesium transporter